MPKLVPPGEIIRAAREKLGLGVTEFAERVGVDRQTVYDWQNNKSAPNRRRAPKVARVLGIPLSALSGDTTHANVAPLSKTAQGKRNVPLVEWVDAGLGAEVVSQQALASATEFVEVVSTVSDAAFALRVKGDSMEPDFHEGDVIVVDPARQPQPDQFVVAELLPNGTPEGHGKVTFKQYVFRGYREGSPSFDLRPLNPDYPTTTVNKNHPGRVLGVVVEHRRVLA